MLQAIRKRQKVLLTIFITLISIVFIFWGFYGGFSRRFSGYLGSGDTASVNGEHITVQEFEREYQNLVRLYQNILKDKFTPEMAERFNLKQLTLNQLIDKKLIAQGAHTLGLKVTDDEIRDNIIQAPYFQKNGKFDKDYYLDLLKANKLTPAIYEESVRLELLQRQVMDLLKNHIKISDEEVWKDYLLKNEKLNLEFIRVERELLISRIALTPEEVQQFLKTELPKVQQYYSTNQHLFKKKEEGKDPKTEKIEPFETAKEGIAKTLLQEQKTSTLAKDITEKLWKNKNQSSFNSLLKEEKLKWEETGLFPRESKYIPKVGESKDIIEAALQLTSQNPFPARYFELHGQYYIVRLKKHETADSKKFDQEKEKAAQALLNQKQSEAYYEWLKELRTKAKIAISKATSFEEE
ncbi:MAG: hypothetical protein A2Z91_05470 [Deltaproteobacteria bacterium GWA2_38_16]|nr:MAG: hypothetical protein A2Z91_05470 [Deltaproteobacteria bacterium GWA2_38_16]OGQ03227.1 MAG: hypothetical protein A3D19_04195 [Deltaproteobacteria bacterium RIFCSPHIGHO2_02_FULL_38_15]OGQ34026.1 MAG: hypothetical protein A3A72_06565 [Deltaproteobacteria bacterium RIFCSPLOWO2_01_FULL_38_9]OGQ59312.1 MAG: hypothetical protein A3G92_05175 [Deltaproteobacteria bacterium RIFCSPLOWO2_12_FULL_38_8]HBQ20346.1 hypothetical protein [Deltaproteobacteria bacterium]